MCSKYQMDIYGSLIEVIEQYHSLSGDSQAMKLEVQGGYMLMAIN